MGPAGLEKNGLCVHDVWEIESTETALFSPGLTNTLEESSELCCVFFFFSNTHPSVRFQLVSHMVGIH